MHFHQLLILVTLLQGHLEIYNSGQWGTVCDDFFGMTDADVVCK